MTFGETLAKGFLDPRTYRDLHRFDNGPSYVVGDGTAICLQDRIEVPVRTGIGPPRAGTTGDVVGLFAEGVALKFEEAVAGVKREFFSWRELEGAYGIGMDRARKRKSVMPEVQTPANST